MPNLSKFPDAPRALARRMRSAASFPDAPRALARRMRSAASRPRTGGWEPLTAEDDERLATEYNRACGFDRPREERAKEVYQAVLSAPQVTWAPMSLRQPAE